MPEPEGATPPKSNKAFFTQKVAGVPLVAWVAVLALVVGAFLWWRNRQQAAAGNATATAAAGAVPTAATSEELMAAGLYQPPNITYNVPSPNIEQGVEEASPGTGVGPLPPVPVTTPPTPAPPPVPTAKPPTPPVSSPVSKMAPAAPTPPTPKYITVTPWPTLTSTLWGISQKVGVPLARIEALNPNIRNPNVIYAGQSIRYA
jgi:LysM repeat protein